jgi:tetratricopeptide (TPR) repeat protein
VDGQTNYLLMKRIFLFFFTCLCISYSNAQTSQSHTRDSLLNGLQKEKTDTGRVLLLAALAFNFHESRPDTAMIIALDALSLSRSIGFKKGEAVSLNRVGNVFSVIDNHPKAMEAYLQALKINEKINNLDGIHRNLGNIGGVYAGQEDYRQALKYLFQAKALAEQIDNKRTLCTYLNSIAQIYYELKTYDSSTLYANQAYNLASQMNIPRIMGTSLVSLGQIHAKTGKHSLALEYFRLAIPNLKTAENDVGLSDAYLGMAELFEKNQQGDSVLFYARTSFWLANEKKFTMELRDAGRFLTAYYRKVNKPDSAFFYLDLTKIANDSLINHQKNNQMQGLVFDEKMRQQEIVLSDVKAKKERAHNIQYAAITLGVITFLILFFALSHSIVVNERWVRFFGILALLVVFELINLFIHPYLAHATDESPFLMLMALVVIAALLIPAHHRLEHWITNRLVEKNKKIRLAAAKKTIAKLEGEQTNYYS